MRGKNSATVKAARSGSAACVLLSSATGVNLLFSSFGSATDEGRHSPATEIGAAVTHRASRSQQRRLYSSVMAQMNPGTTPAVLGGVPLWKCPQHVALQELARKAEQLHLRELLNDKSRNEALFLELEKDGSPASDRVILDLTREKVTQEALDALLQLAGERKLKDKIAAMFAGEKLNSTEGRPVLHAALRCHAGDKFSADGKDVTSDVLQVLQRIEDFSNEIRSGKRLGHTGRPLTDIICIGIGGSYLGPEFVYEALRTHPAASEASSGRRLRFLSNIDPIDVARATEGLSPETTLVIVISKTFTTAETMLNAKTVRNWLGFGNDPAAIAKHVVAVSTNIAATQEFGIDKNNVFGFWDWVGGRYSVCSAVGALPLALHFGFPFVREFLDGCRWMDKHFASAPLEKNLPVLLGLTSVWNSTYLKHPTVAILPYCQALLRFAPHVQQLTMESNGKRVTTDGIPFPADTGEVFFGEPGTNGQHSFYQLLHQGQVIPAEFIGFARTQKNISIPGEQVPNHHELMSNFFAQPDALAFGKSVEELKKESVPEALLAHKTFPGDRPSLSILLPECNAFYIGALLALYEHRTAVQGFVWGLNSFDQWGVELGKALAKNVRGVLSGCDAGEASLARSAAFQLLPKPTQTMISKFLQMSSAQE